MPAVTTRIATALAIALAMPGCRQLFGIDDTEVAGGDASGDGAVVADASTDRIDGGAPDAPPPPPDALVMATCPGFTQIANGFPPGATYRGVQPGRTWVQARDDCRVQSAELVIVDNAAEADAVAALVQDPVSAYFWHGVFLAGGTWMTVRGAPATYLPWAPGEPSGGASACTLFDDTVPPHLLHDFQCPSTQVYVCECLP